MEEKVQEEGLDKIVEHLEEEARMVLPGIQALFGFQLIAVFNQRFEELSKFDQGCHFAALLCSAFSILCVLTPAAYHRQAEPTSISSFFCRVGTFFLTLSMLPLALGTSLDLYVISRLVFENPILSMATGFISFIFFISAWFLFPFFSRK
jgi:hypothetical protein